MRIIPKWFIVLAVAVAFCSAGAAASPGDPVLEFSIEDIQRQISKQERLVRSLRLRLERLIKERRALEDFIAQDKLESLAAQEQALLLLEQKRAKPVAEAVTAAVIPAEVKKQPGVKRTGLKKELEPGRKIERKPDQEKAKAEEAKRRAAEEKARKEKEDYQRCAQEKKAREDKAIAEEQKRRLAEAEAKRQQEAALKTQQACRQEKEKFLAEQKRLKEEASRQRKMISVLEEQQRSRQKKNVAIIEDLIRKQKTLFEEGKRLEMDIQREEKNLKDLEQRKEALVQKRKGLKTK